MNVLLTSYMGSGALTGVRTYYELLLKHAEAYGVNVELATPDHCSRMVRYGTAILRRLTIGTGCVWGANSILIENIVYWLRSRSAIGRVSRVPDLIHAQDPGSASAALRVFGGTVPVITTCHFNDDPTDEALLSVGRLGESARLLRAWHTFTFRHTRNWIAVSRYAAGKLRRLIPSDATIEVVHNGLDFDRISGFPSNHALRKEHPGKTLVLNVGYLDPRKNQRLLLKIASVLREQPVVFFVVGDGPDRSWLDSEIARLNLNDTVHLLGRREDVLSLMHTCDIYLHTATNENCPFVLIEAMAAGLPVLAAASGGTPELLPGSAGTFSLTASPESIAQRIALWATEPESRLRMANQQREYAQSELNLDRMMRRTVEIYRKVLREGT
jgi:glycogen synthase